MTDIDRTTFTEAAREFRAEAKAHADRPRLVPIPWSQIHTLAKRESLIAGLLDRGAFSVVYGVSNSGKSFFTLDLGARIALRDEWRGRKVRHGAVVYIAAEGGLGIEERLTAFREYHSVDAEGVPLYVIPEPIDLCRSDQDATLLQKRIVELPAEPPIELIVIDTLSRAISGGNENSSEDMGAFVRYCDALRMTTGAHVMVIHHAGKDETRGARGHSLLKAAADTEIEIARATGIAPATAIVAKQRDHRSGDVFGFRLELVEIGQDEDGKAITSCVVIETDDLPAKASRTQRSMTKAAQTALRALQEAIDDLGKPAPASNHIPEAARVVTLSQWREYAYRRGISASDGPRAKQSAFKRASEYLIGGSHVGVWGEYTWTV